MVLDGPLPLFKKILCSCAAGALGGVAGNPADVLNVRMQADRQLPTEQRRNYKHALDGLVRIVRDEGFAALYRGCAPNVARAVFMTAGQIATYDQAKEMVIASGLLTDGVRLHFASSLLAGLVATIVTSPMDVVKTRVMSAAPGTYSSTWDCVMRTLRHEGPTAFMKGFVPAYTRLGPHTILTFIFLEQLRSFC